MKKRVFYLLSFLCLLLATGARAQAPAWSVNGQDYAYQMALVGALNIDGVEATDTRTQLAAFIDGQCRGVGRLEYISSARRYLVYMNIYHDTGEGLIKFKIYDAIGNRVLDLEQTEDFEIQKLKGSTSAPAVFSYPRLSSEARFFTFKLPGQVKSSVDGTAIAVELPYGAELSGLVPEFTTSPLAKVFIGDKLQKSGETPNNYASPLVYRVIAADETAVTNYTVTVKYSNAKPTLVTQTASVSSLAAPGSLVAQLQGQDADDDKSQLQYSLLDTHVPFALSADGKLTVSQVLAYLEPASYTLRIGVSDQKDMTENTLTVTVNKTAMDGIRLEVSNVITPNGDNMNDYWEVKQGHLFEHYDFKVLDTFGREVFYRKGYAEPLWDGSYQGRKLPTGTYIYIVKSAEQGKVFKGTITILH
jgi:gliding motility-associated-like protein